MTVARNQTKSFSFNEPGVAGSKPRKASRQCARLLDIERKRSSNKSALPARVRQKKLNGNWGRIVAAKAVSNTSMEVGPTVALCLLLFDELSF